METNIKIFENVLFGQVRSVMDESNEPWFCLTDICEALGLQTHKVVQRLESTLLSKYPTDTGYGIKQVNFVNEDGLYDVILDSRKPEAKKFRKWITSEVLPSIRKDGGYIMAKEEETEEELMQRALNVAQARIERMKVEKALLEEKNKKQHEVILEQAPKVEYHDKVLASTSTYTVTQIAKEFGKSAVSLNKKLHDFGVQYYMNGQWLLYSKYQGKGYTKSITRQYIGASGQSHTSQLTVWTEIGRKFIHELLKA